MSARGDMPGARRNGEGAGFLEHLLTVVGSNPGAAGSRSALRGVLKRGRRSGPESWSRRDIDGIFKAFRGEPEETADGNLMHVHPGGAGLIAFKTDDVRQPYGYGEFSELRLVQIVPPEVADPAYRRALQLCVERLGDPHLVGGPNAFALWRFEDDTIELARLQGSECRLQLTREPTQPSERHRQNEPRPEPELEPEILWRAVPDRQYSGPALAGRAFSPGRNADDPGQLYRTLGAVFGSLAADVPLLHRYTSDIAWSIGIWGEPGFLARGQFSFDGCAVETTIHGRTQSHRLAPGYPSGVEVAASVMDAIGGADVKSLRDLHYSASATEQPRQVTDTHFGLQQAPAAPDLDRSQWRGRPKVVHAYIQSETTYDWIDGELHEVSHTEFDPPKRAR
ncbi:hypothetical protein [Nocardia heshunensis]